MILEKNKYVSLFTKFVNNTERTSSSIDEKALKLTKKTTKLDSILEEFDLGYIKVFLPPKNSFLLSWKKWKKYLETFDLDILSEDDIYNLAFDYDALNNDEYWKILKNKKFITENILFSLIRNLHYYWTDLNNFENIIKYTKNFLQAIKTDSKIINKWKKYPGFVLGLPNISLENIILKAIKHDIKNLSTIYSDKYYEIQKNDLISNIVQYEFLSEAIQTKRFLEQLDYFFELCLEFINYSIKPEFRNGDERKVSQSLKTKRDSLLAELITIIDSISYRNEEYKDRLIEYVLQCTIYGDPRLNEWADYDFKHAMDTFKTWLNEKDIKFFFENLIGDDPHDRKGFWLENASKIDSAIFVIGNDVEVNRKNYEQIKKFKKSTSKNIFTIGDEYNYVKSNIFILKMKNIVAIEFSESGNACYMYFYDFYMKKINPLLQTINSRANATLSNFKDKGCIETFRHDQWGTWQGKIRSFLKRYII